MTNSTIKTTRVIKMANDGLETGTAIAKRIFDEIMDPNFKLPEGRKKHRGIFIERAMAEAFLTERGASTYFHNFQCEARGLGRYYANKSAEEKKAILARVQQEDEHIINADAAPIAAEHMVSSEAAIEEVEPIVEEKQDVEQHRWLVVDENGNEHTSYKTRAAAQKAAKELGMKWDDRNKKVA